MKIKDIANELHLSVSTVSKALNGAFDVSKETKELVLEYAKKHGYKSRDERLAVKSIRRLCVLYDNVNPTSHSNVITQPLHFQNMQDKIILKWFITLLNPLRQPMQNL